MFKCAHDNFEENIMMPLQSLDLRKPAEVLSFLCGLQELSCHAEIDIESMLCTFAELGYEPCEHAVCADNAALPQWIIADALSSLQKNGFIHPNIHQHVQWCRENNLLAL
ncbi:hypothetical protein A3C87_00070 [Candidatus Kaiserbacteria bacterium RIFCSPHIGHO2_02_FULL_49_34]|uniref:Uncharacterized protein n=1 Tax=Candidatus Kaiserbacteria bacterium RIFCSPHIGHO2_02_FULL_49_34 TaxID=1798491 RepID=A0A1F6DIU2_9BACT|nr:MAG: hypothetical protein A3C87_00070 [Candidatus Kaiserbacteria bacterium RIFCSPHIGHO2_02_FULL_49_34]